MNNAEALKQIHEILEENFWCIELVPFLGEAIRDIKDRNKFHEEWEDWDDYHLRINNLINQELNWWFTRTVELGNARRALAQYGYLPF